MRRRREVASTYYSAFALHLIIILVPIASLSLLMRPASSFLLSPRYYHSNLHIAQRLLTPSPAALHTSRIGAGVSASIRTSSSTRLQHLSTLASSSGSMKRPLPDNEDEQSTTADAEERKPLVVIIAGPTGVGKSSVAMSLCQSTKATQLLQSCGLISSTSSNDGDNAVGNIVSADSVQAYRGVQVGANKPTDDERTKCPHHLIDVVGSNELAYNAADWMRDAIFAIGELYGENVSRDGKEGEEEDSLVDEEVLASRRKRKEDIHQGVLQARSQGNIPLNAPILPIVVGGTMMYLQWLVHGRPDAMRPTDEALERAAADIKKFQAMDGGTFDSAGNEEPEPKAESCDEASDTSTTPSAGWNAAATHASLLGKTFKARVDKLCGKDWYRLRRILEVAYTIGAEKATEEQLEAVYSGERFGGLGNRGYDVRCFFLCPDDRLKHAEVIDRRCEDMLLRGLLTETANLSVAGELPDNGQPARAIGYRQTLDYLRRKEAKQQDDIAFNAYMDEFTTATRRYAKKQMGWFRKDGEFMFIPVSISKPSQQRVEEAANTILQMCMLPRNDYERELFSDRPKANEAASSKAKKSRDAIDPDILTLAARTKLQNAKQGKEMKFYQGGKRYQIVEGTAEHETVLEEADASTTKIQGRRALSRT